MEHGLHSECTRVIIGCALRVYSILGGGHSEKIYEKALREELRRQNVNFASQKRVSIRYRYHTLADFTSDIIVEQKVAVELKARSSLTSYNVAQLLTYLRVTGIRVGLLLNFGNKRFQIKRLIL